MKVYKFLCGHVGRGNEPPWNRKAKAMAFIRVAEIRGCPVELVGKKCPECS